MKLAHPGLGGLAVSEQYLVFGDRDLENLQDVFRCVDANTGTPIWEVQRLAIGRLDYGNSPRSTPLISDGRVFFLGAFGDLLCIDLKSGNVVWEVNLPKRFKSDIELPWGFCGSPLLVNDMIIVAPGSPEASIVALDSKTGKLIWQTPGVGPSYGSLIIATLGGVNQIVGHDADSLGGWDIKTGRRLWKLKPEVKGDFNVPTPIVYEHTLLITTENNGTRLYGFDETGVIQPEPVALNRRLRPDMSTPIIVQDRLYCVKEFLYCLNMKQNLKERWRLRDPALSDYATVIASSDRILIFGDGELLLLDGSGEKKIQSRSRIFPEDTPIYSHPAIVGNRLYVRGENSLVCVEF